jgi:uncharacterized protein (DUF1697 family)
MSSSSSRARETGTRTHIALLRGINVGGRNKVAMADLRRVVGGLGHTEVATYIQSGNIAFAAAGLADDSSNLAAGIERAIAGELTVRPAVVVASRDELQQVVAGNPFASEPNPRLVHAVFLPDAPGPDRVEAIAEAVERARAKGSRDEAHVEGRALYLWTPDGMGRSVLTVELDRGTARIAPAAAGTARNWATVLALVQLLDR